MKRKTLGFLALSVSALLVLQTPTTAMAECWVNDEIEEAGEGTSEYEHTDNVVVTGLSYSAVVADTEGDKLKINGSVTSTSEPELHDENGGTYFPSPVYAGNGAEITITEDVSAEYAPAIVAGVGEGNSGGKVFVGGDVSSNKGSAAIADGSGSSITINGDATSESGLAVEAFDGGSVTVGGDVKSNSEEAPAVVADNNGTVDIKGNVSGVNGGIYSSNSSKVNVDKGVSASSGVAIYADNSNVTVGGDVTGGIYKDANGSDTSAPAITMDSTSTVVVKGNVETANKDIDEETAIIINHGADSNGALIVLGDVTAHGEYGNAIWINDAKTSGYLPKIVVGSLNADKEELLVGLDAGEDTDKLLESIYGNIMYYINIEQPKGGTINVTSDTKKYNDQYLVANEHGSVSFSVTPDEGYELDSVAGGKVDVIKNDDGTYTIKVPRGGGIKISALLKAIEKVIPPSSEAPVIKVTSSKKSDDTPSTPVLTAAKSYSVFNNTIQKDITSVPQNGTLKIDMGNWISFNKKTFELLSKRSDVAITITYKYNGQTYKVTIPAGYPIMDLLDENGYCGCLYLNSIFGSELVTK